jgi:propionyl-CoA synthetase
MPMVPEAAIAMLAGARLGAVDSVVFGGFAASELATRIDDAKPKVVVQFNAIHWSMPILSSSIRLK